MVGPKRSGIFPLRVRDLVSLLNRNPSILANRHARSLIRFLEPRNDLRRFGPVAAGGFVVVGQRAVKWVLPRREFYWSVIVPARRIRIIQTAVTLRPLFVPRTGAVGYRIIFAWFFSDPENGRHDLALPRVRFPRRWRGRSQMTRHESERFNADV